MNDSIMLKVTGAIAHLLARPGVERPGPNGASLRQHLAYGPTGIALLHIERAASGLGPWQRAHDWLAAATRAPFTAGPDSHPFYGAPALAHAMACAADHASGAYQRTLTLLDRQLAVDVRRRLDAAHRRIDAGQLPDLAEFDTIRGLAGYGAYFLRRAPSGEETRAILDYCVRLTEPITHNGEVLPGWWTLTGPSGLPDSDFPDGHGNTGMAHGIGGVLALLALAAEAAPRRPASSSPADDPGLAGPVAGRKRPRAHLALLGDARRTTDRPPGPFPTTATIMVLRRCGTGPRPAARCHRPRRHRPPTQRRERARGRPH